MIHLVLDTSIFRSDPKREKPAFRAVKQLAQVGHLKLHVPYWVKREFVTQQSSLISDRLAEITSAAKGILRSTTQQDLIRYAQEINDDVDSMRARSADLLLVEFNQWLETCRAVEYSVNPEHAQRVTDDYFSGAPPFTGLKHRTDIPDSFIWQSILDISNENAPLTIVSNDGSSI
jgi:hypothetical protein